VKSGGVSQDEPPRELVQALLDEFPHSNEKQARRRPGARSSASLWGVEKEYVAQPFDLYQPRSLDTLEACTLGAAALSRR
jgi:hypothetical protein